MSPLLMKLNMKKSIAAAACAATIVVSMISLTGCEGRRMSNMQPNGETVEVEVSVNDTAAVATPVSDTTRN